MKCEIPERDWAQKLDQTICRYKGVPYWVRPDGRGRITLYNLPGQTQTTVINGNDPDFDIAGLPLGYVNLDKTLSSFYLTRIPYRKTKQGTAPNSVRSDPIPNFQQRGDQVHRWGSNNIMLTSQGFVNMVLNNYPSVPEALSTLRKAIKKTQDVHQIAVSRDIAMVIDTNELIHVFFKQELVGWMEPGKNIVHVKSDAMAQVVSKYLSRFLGWVID